MRRMAHCCLPSTACKSTLLSPSGEFLFIFILLSNNYVCLPVFKIGWEEQVMHNIAVTFSVLWIRNDLVRFRILLS